MSICASAAAPRASSSSTSTRSGGRFKGIRNGATWHADPSLEIYCSGAPQGLYRDRNFREGFAGLASLGLSFDAWMFQTQLDDVLDLARAFPQATIVFNHVGGPLAIGPYAGKREEAFAAWKKLIGEVASLPNTYVKFGGLGMKLTGFTFFENDSRLPRRIWRRRGGPISRPASRRSAPSARCSRAISRSTRACAAIR